MPRARAGKTGVFVVAVVALMLALQAVPFVRAEEGDDEAFLESLRTSKEVDRRALARFLFGVASTLDSGRGSVRMLQEALTMRDPYEAYRSQEPRDSLRGAHENYIVAVRRMKTGVGDLLDRPESPLRLFRVLGAGHRACWMLDAQITLGETYGATGAELRAVLSSSGACDKFRSVAFQPRVERLVELALADDSDLAAENRVLREEIDELERLFEDLRRIDEAD
jgi:hypothetical protein